MTPRQIDIMRSLNNYIGQTVDVLTSEYTANVAPDFVRSAVATVSSPALRGLEKRGFVRIEDAFWKGATVTVLRLHEEKS